MTRLATVLLLLSGLFVAFTGAAAEPPKITITGDPLGDSAQHVVVRLTFHFSVPQDVPGGVPLIVSGAVTQSGQIPLTFRYTVDPARPDALSGIQTLAPGEAEVEARLMIPLEESAPVILAKGTAKITVVSTGKEYVAGANPSADAIVAEGMTPDTSDAVRIVTPRRDVAPNLFIVDVETKPIVKKVEFWVEGKKIVTRNAPPYHAELDLGALPKRVEVRAVGYDARGNYVDADAFVVNEREIPLEIKITRTATPDGMVHVKLSLQNPKGTGIKNVVLFAGDKKLHEWTSPPYSMDIPATRLTGVEFLRASALDDTNYEASDLVFLNGEHYSENIEVNLVELPVSVLDAGGAPIANLNKSDFTVLESGKPQKITSFNFASNLPISAGLLIDHSGSMEKRMDATKKAAGEFLARIIKSGDRAFVGGFSFDETKLAPFVSDVGSLQAQVDAIPKAGGGTSLYDAIITGLYRFRGVQGRKALIVLTDGEDTTSRIPYEQMLAYVRSSRVPIYFIGIALGFSDIAGARKMHELADETGAVAYFIKDVKQLDATYTQLEKELRSQYLIAYETSASKKDTAYRTIEVKVDKPGAVVRTIRGFIP
jgi:Ca-activated chloride channel family protein